MSPIVRGCSPLPVLSCSTGVKERSIGTEADSNEEEVAGGGLWEENAADSWLLIDTKESLVVLKYVIWPLMGGVFV